MRAETTTNQTRTLQYMFNNNNNYITLQSRKHLE